MAIVLTLVAGLFVAPQMSSAQQKLGTVTKLPLPRFVSMKATEAFARRGPGKNHKIDWKFMHRGMPLKVVDEHGHWRQIEDNEGEGGWVHYALLSRVRTVLVVDDEVEMFDKPAGLSRLVAKLSDGVVGDFIGCAGSMCEIEVSNDAEQKFRGWVARGAIWGVTGSE